MCDQLVGRLVLSGEKVTQPRGTDKTNSIHHQSTNKHYRMVKIIDERIREFNTKKRTKPLVLPLLDKAVQKQVVGGSAVGR